MNVATPPSALASMQPSGAAPSPQGQGGSPAPAQPQGGAMPLDLPVRLGQMIDMLEARNPQASQGIKMMRDGLRQVLASSASSQQPPAPPR